MNLASTWEGNIKQIGNSSYYSNCITWADAYKLGIMKPIPLGAKFY